MIFIVGSTVAVFLCLLLWMKKGKTQADLILLLWLAVLALNQILVYGEISGFFYRYPHLLALSFPIPIMHSILLFFYAKSMSSGRRLHFKNVFPHFLPTILLLILAMPFHLLSAEEKIAVFKNQGKGFEGYLLFREILMFASGVGYVAWTLLLLRKHRDAVENAFSNTEHKNLRWLQLLSIGLGLIWGLAFFFNDAIIYTGVTGFVLFIGLYGIQQMPIFHSGGPDTSVSGNSADDDAEAPPAPGESVRYAKSGLKDEDIARIYARLQQLMAEQAPYQNPELTLADLAKILDIHPNYLSQVINEREQKNFFHYINSLRAEAFLRLAAQPENKRFTLLALAFDCGFNSKTTFNKYFKHHTGKTPSEFFQANN